MKPSEIKTQTPLFRQKHGVWVILFKPVSSWKPFYNLNLDFIPRTHKTCIEATENALSLIKGKEYHYDVAIVQQVDVTYFSRIVEINTIDYKIVWSSQDVSMYGPNYFEHLFALVCTTFVIPDEPILPDTFPDDFLPQYQL